MDNTSTIGTRTEGMVLAALLQLRKKVLVPFGGGSRYDLAFDEDGKLVRVQCKTGALRNGCVVFNTHSQARNGQELHYHGAADLFGVYCPDNETVYLVPVEDMGRSKGYLRVDPPRNNWKPDGGTVRSAEKYKVA
jgi:hypothetical protein